MLFNKFAKASVLGMGDMITMDIFGMCRRYSIPKSGSFGKTRSQKALIFIIRSLV